MAKAPKANEVATESSAGKECCGIIMPIAAMPGYEAEHWGEVLTLVNRAIVKSGRVPEPVWAGGAADIIQARIVRNLYEYPIAVCDVSGLNPNVMLELGMRLAFGKATIIVTDELQKLPLDINAIGYLPYPRDLRITRTEAFIDRLAERIEEVSARVKANTYHPFIKTFGPIEPGAPGTDAIPLQDAVLRQLEQMGASLRRLESGQWSAHEQYPSVFKPQIGLPSTVDGAVVTVPKSIAKPTRKALEKIPWVMLKTQVERGDRIEFTFAFTSGLDPDYAEAIFLQELPSGAAFAFTL